MLLLLCECITAGTASPRPARGQDRRRRVPAGGPAVAVALAPVATMASASSPSTSTADACTARQEESSTPNPRPSCPGTFDETDCNASRVVGAVLAAPVDVREVELSRLLADTVYLLRTAATCLSTAAIRPGAIALEEALAVAIDSNIHGPFYLTYY